MPEPQAQSPQPSGKASLKDGKEKCPLSGTVSVVLRTADSKPVEATLNVKLTNKEGSYTATATKGTAMFDDVKPGEYVARLDVPDDVEYIQSGKSKPDPVKAVKQQVKLVTLQVRKKPWIGWRVLDLATNKTISNAKFKATVPAKEGATAPVEFRSAGDEDVARIEKLKGETVELTEVETATVLIFDSLESK
jgi:hypothetical protein